MPAGRGLTALALITAGIILMVSYISILESAGEALVALAGSGSFGHEGSSARTALKDIGLGFGLVVLVFATFLAAAFTFYGKAEREE